MPILLIVFLSILISLLIALFTGKYWIEFARRIKLENVPFQSVHNINPVRTPLAGGLIILSALLPSIILAIVLYNDLDQTVFIIKLLIPLLIIFVFGVIDDLRGLSAFTKFFGQILAITVFILSGNFVDIFTLKWLNIGLTFFWLAGITNAFNLIDSREGIVCGISVEISMFLLFATFFSQQYFLSILAAVILGSCLGVRYYNNKPGKTFLGDSGAQLLGFLLAAIALVYIPAGYKLEASWFLPILLFLFPIFDTSFVFITRLINRKNPFVGDLNHTYHRLSRILESEDDAIQFLMIFSITSGLLAFTFLEINSIISSFLFIFVGLVTIGFGIFLIKKDKNSK